MPATLGTSGGNPGCLRRQPRALCGVVIASRRYVGGFHSTCQVGQFSGGEGCPGGVRRSLRVGFECAEEEALGRVDEPDPCGYSVSLATPAAC